MTGFETPSKCIGLLLAAGRGRRMGGNKQFHIVPTPAGDKPLVAAAYDTVAHACDRMIVVVGHRADEVKAILAPRVFVIIESDPDALMIDSIKAGLSATLSRNATRSGSSSIILQLGDHPALEQRTLENLLTIAVEHPERAVMPVYQGNGGHPVLIPANIAEKILASPCPGGLRQFWLDHPEHCLRVPVDDRGAIYNLNTI